LLLLLLYYYYYYVVGSDADGWSQEFQLKTLPAPGKPVRYAIYGDFGWQNSVSLPRLINETTSRNIDMIIHVGDMAYNLHDNRGMVGDNFMNMIQPMSTMVPYQVCPGNHELDRIGDFHNYKNRFSMPNYETNENMYHSFDVGPVHFIAYNTECYLDGVEIPFVEMAYWWLIDDLEKATKNRDNVPWIIVYAHRPMYCTDTDEKDCTSEARLIKDGFDILGDYYFGIEDIFWQYGVDMFICGHEHNYERIWPVYKEKVLNGSTSSPYTNPKAPVYIVTGAAGCSEDLEYIWLEPIPSYSAFRNGITYGYGRMTVYNETMLTFEQVLAKDGSILDSINLIKDSHGPYSKL